VRGAFQIFADKQRHRRKVDNLAKIWNTPVYNWVLIFTSNRISRLFLSGPACGGIEKMRSIFFQKTKSSGVPVTKPAGSEAKATRQKGSVQIHKSLTGNAISPGILFCLEYGYSEIPTGKLYMERKIEIRPMRLAAYNYSIVFLSLTVY
jgi:hypothetical protein